MLDLAQIWIVNEYMMQMTINITDENEEEIKTALMSEIAAQFGEGEMMPSVEFR